MSKFLTLNIKDLLKGVIVASLTAILGGLYAIIQTGAFPTIADRKAMGMAALWAWLAYLLKNLFTNQEGDLLTK